nr:MAG TPA: hypothetical protein [Caudoviricetes sp.]
MKSLNIYPLQISMTSDGDIELTQQIGVDEPVSILLSTEQATLVANMIEQFAAPASGDA